MYAPFAYVGGGGESYAIEFSLLLRYPAGTNVSDARKALKIKVFRAVRN